MIITLRIETPIPDPDENVKLSVALRKEAAKSGETDILKLIDDESRDPHCCLNCRYAEKRNGKLILFNGYIHCRDAKRYIKSYSICDRYHTDT